MQYGSPRCISFGAAKRASVCGYSRSTAHCKDFHLSRSLLHDPTYSDRQSRHCPIWPICPGGVVVSISSASHPNYCRRPLKRFGLWSTIITMRRSPPPTRTFSQDCTILCRPLGPMPSTTPSSSTSLPTRYLATDLGRTALETGICPDSLRPTLQRIAHRGSGILSSTLRSTQRGQAMRTIAS